ncbi:MAG TPA: S8 family serine peptidase, partial [Dehalococcoidia bacterium]|nr:S8 family serine peptidase [Dehalococcoidia bacterium]
VLIPGTARGAMTVAATRGNASLGSPTTIPDFPVDTLEAFSSQGPTIDGRTKPEIAAPDAVMVAVATANPVASPFFGTSAAAPHVAGGAALLKGEDTTRTADELENVLLRLATDQNIIAPITRQDGTPATVAEAGVGRLTLRSGLDTKPPTIVFSFPLNGSTITTAQPTIVAVITDTETGVDPSTIVLAIDGTTVMWDSFNPTTGVVTYRPVTPLSRAAHTATLDAADIAGNVGVQGITNFRVGLPTLSAGLHMISLPFRNLLDANPASIFGVGVNELGLVRWVPTDTAFNKYRIFPDPLASFEPPDATGVSNPTVPSPPAGLGYFLNLPREVILNVAGETLSDVPSYTIQLPFGVTDPTGWHMIGNPFQDTVDWSTVQFQSGNVRLDLDDAIAAGWTEGIIFEYIPAAGALAGRYEFVQPLAAILESMKG